MKEILALTRWEGRYFEELKPEEKQNFTQIMADYTIPSNRMVRITNKLKELVKMENKKEAYESFLTFIFDAAKVSGKLKLY